MNAARAYVAAPSKDHDRTGRLSHSTTFFIVSSFLALGAHVGATGAGAAPQRSAKTSAEPIGPRGAQQKKPTDDTTY